MSDVNIKYKGASIADLNATGKKTLLTSGKYCEADIEVEYTKPGGGANIDTKTITNSDATATSLSFTGLLGTPKAFFLRCTTTLSRSSSYRHYYVATMRFNGTNTTGNRWYRYNGQVSNISSGYSYTYSNGTLTLHSSGNQTTSPGSFYNGTYELVYIY